MTAWAAAADSSTAKFVLTLPPAVGTPPAGAPEPGVYQLRVGQRHAGSPGGTRSARPLSASPP